MRTIRNEAQILILFLVKIAKNLGNQIVINNNQTTVITD